MARNTSSTPDQAGKCVISKFGPPSVLRWHNNDPFSELTDDKLLVKILVAGIAGPDNSQRAGGYPHPACQKPGFTPGYDYVGEILAIGKSTVTDLSIGDRVASMCMIGGHSTHIISAPEDLIKIDKDIDPVKVATLPLNYMTAWGMLKRSGVNLNPGSSILIGSASGGVGTVIAQVVHAFNLQLKMIGTCSPSKFDYVRSLGITPIDRHSHNIAEQVKDLTDGKGVDVAYDAVSSQESIMQSHLATKDDIGEVIIISAMSEIKADGSGVVNPNKHLGQILSERTVPRMRTWGVERDYYRGDLGLFRKDFYRLLEKVRNGTLDPVIMKKYRLEDAVEVHEKLISGVGIQGKMVFIVDEELAKRNGL